MDMSQSPKTKLRAKADLLFSFLYQCRSTMWTTYTATNVYITNITCHIKVGRKHPLPSSMILRQQPHCILCLWLYIINTFCLFHPFSTTNKHFDRTCLILIIRPLDTSLETLQMLHCRIGKPHNGQDSWGRLNHTHGKRRFKKSTTADQRANESFRSWGW